jgi:mannose-6-phosphate isomerase class I
MVKPESLPQNEECFSLPTDEFQLSWIRIEKQKHYESAVNRNIEIILTSEGTAEFTVEGVNTPVFAGRGESVLIPAEIKKYTLRGPAQVFKATVP